MQGYIQNYFKTSYDRIDLMQAFYFNLVLQLVNQSKTFFALRNALYISSLSRILKECIDLERYLLQIISSITESD